MNDSFKNNFLSSKESLREKIGLLAAFLSVFIGLFVGSLVYVMPDFSLKSELTALFISFNTELNDKMQIEIFSGFLISGLLYFIIMFFCGGNIFGKVLSLIITAVKAAGISTLTAYFFDQYGMEGFEYVLLVFMPGNCILIFAMLFLTEICFDTSSKLRLGSGNSDTKAIIKLFTFKSVAAFGFIFLSVIMDYLCLIGFSGLISFMEV